MSEYIRATLPTGNTYYAKPLPIDTDPTWADDVVALTESGTVTSLYESASIADPADVYAIFLQAGGSPADSDTVKALVEMSSHVRNAILADADEMQQDLADGGRLDVILDAILTDTGATIPALIAALNNLSQAEANAACDQAISDAGLATAAALAIVDAIVDAIKAKSDQLNFTGNDVKATLDGEEVTPTTASKTGYKLAADGLDSITASEPSAKPANFREWVMWLVQRFRRSKMDRTAGKITVEQEDGTAVTEQTFSDDGTTQQLGEPSDA